MHFSDELITDVIQNIENASQTRNMDYFCTSRDVFTARIDSYVLRTNKFLQSAIIGEIGNNTFDHNWDYAKEHVRGAYFNPEYSDNIIVLADFGRGVRKSLEAVRSFNNDLDALKTAFTEEISGRAPEQRGNGLKFVSENMCKNQWSLYFQSGTACCIIEEGKIEFKNSNISIIGCLAIMDFSGD